LESQEVVQVAKAPDSLELDFGGTRKGGKIYFDALNPEEAKQKVSNMKVIALHAEAELSEFRRSAEALKE